MATSVSDARLSLIPINSLESDGLTICLHGILQRYTQFLPLGSSLPGRGYGVNDQTPRYDLDGLVTFVRSVLTHALPKDAERNLVGASMGGMQIPFIVEGLSPSQRRMLGKIVLVDAPTGAATMKEMPTQLAGLVESPLGAPIMALINQFMLKPPKDREIDLPSDWQERQLHDPTFTEQSWREQVKLRAMANMRGFSGRIYHNWTSWMIRVGRDGSLARAAHSLRGLDVTYLACTSLGNGTVRQPDAYDWWEEHTDAKVVEVDAVHCGFLQQQAKFEEAFRRIFS